MPVFPTGSSGAGWSPFPSGKVKIIHLFEKMFNILLLAGRQLNL
jgi:hypothetical protein